MTKIGGKLLNFYFYLNFSAKNPSIILTWGRCNDNSIGINFKKTSRKKVRKKLLASKIRLHICLGVFHLTINNPFFMVGK